MAVRSSQVLFVGGDHSGGVPSGTYNTNWFIIDRIQSGDINPNITNETIEEVGNTKAVGIIRDAPAALTCTIESYDVTPKLEALLLGLDAATLTQGQQLDFNNQVPFNLICPVRGSINLATITGGIIVPYMSLSEVTYRFGLKQDAQQTFTLNGDSMFYGPPGTSPYEDVFTSTGATGESFTLTNAAVPYFNPPLGATQYVLNVTVYPNDGTTPYRLMNGATFDFQDTASGFTLNAGVSVPSGYQITAQYFSELNDSIPQTDNSADGIAVKPAAVRPWSIDVYWAPPAATPSWTRLTGVQSIDLTWQAQGFEANDEFGSALSVSFDYVIPAVSGTITTRPDSVALMSSQLADLLNVSAGNVIGMLSGQSLQLLIVLKCPNGVTGITPGTPLKTIYVPDAIFDPPQMTARAGQKIDLPFKFYSNTGTLYEYNGFPGDLSFAYDSGN